MDCKEEDLGVDRGVVEFRWHSSLPHLLVLLVALSICRLLHAHPHLKILDNFPQLTLTGRPLLQQSDVQCQDDHAFGLRPFLVRVFMNSLHHVHDVVNNRVAELVLLRVQQFLWCLGNEVSQTPDRVFNRAEVWILAHIRQHLSEMVREGVVLLPEILDVLRGQAHNGKSDHLEENVVFGVRRACQLVQEEVEDVVALLDVHLDGVAEDVNDHVEQLTPDVFGKDALLALEQLA